MTIKRDSEYRVGNHGPQVIVLPKSLKGGSNPAFVSQWASRP